MLNGLRKNDQPVMFQISGLSKFGNYYFKMDSEEFSLYVHEQEILLYDGSKYEITNITE